MLKVNEFFQPASLEAAAEILKKDPDYKILAGGTSIVFNNDAKIKGLVDITRLDLKYIAVEENIVHIGSLVTINELKEAEEIVGIGDGIFVKVASVLSNNLTRNLCTVGGNIARPFWWSDLPGLFLTLDASVIIFSDGEELEIKLKDLYDKKYKLKNSDILVEVNFEIPEENRVFNYDTVLKTKTDFSITSVYHSYVNNGGKIQDPAIYISAVEALPKKLEKLENALNGKELTEAAFEEAYKNVDEIKPIRDIRVSKDYKKVLVKEVLKRNLVG